MALYRVYSISDKKDLFTKVSQNQDEIGHHRFTTFNIINKAKFIQCDGKDSLEMPFSTEDNIIYGEVDIKVLITRYKHPYCIVALSGSGLFVVGKAMPKYINEEILPYIKKHIENKYKIPIEFKAFEYENNHFSTKYWGNHITTKFGYNSNSKMYIRISCTDVNKLLEENPYLKSYYETGTIKSIKGKNSELEYILEHGKKYPGYFKFGRNGVIKCEFFDIIFFNDFLKKLIDNGFYRGE